MKRFYFTLLTYALVIAAPFMHAAEHAMLSDLAAHSLLLDINKVGDHKLIAVGERGHIVLSNDGYQWLQANVPSQSTLTAVYFIDDKKGWAVGHNSTILHSSNGGQTWHEQFSDPLLQKPLLDVIFKNGLEGIAVGAYGQFYRTQDGGKSWQEEFHQAFLNEDDRLYLQALKQEDEEAYLDEKQTILPHFNRIFLDGRTLYLLGEMGLVVKSNDFGKSWHQYKGIYHGSFYDVTRTQMGNLLIVGMRGHVFRSVDNAKSWFASNTYTNALINAIVLSDDDRLFLLGNQGVLLESYNDGITFHPLRVEGNSALVAGIFYHGRIVAATNMGIKNIEVNK